MLCSSNSSTSDISPAGAATVFISREKHLRLQQLGTVNRWSTGDLRESSVGKVQVYENLKDLSSIPRTYVKNAGYSGMAW